HNSAHSKGFGHVDKHDFTIDGVRIGRVSYFEKKEIGLTKHVFFGSLGELKPGRDAMTDPQSLVNFRQYEFMYERFKEISAEVFDLFASGDEAALNHALYSRMAKMENQDGHTWALMAALNRGVSVFTEP